MKQAIMKHEAEITQDLSGKTVTITRVFDAPVEKVWRAWTQPEILDQWWAPKPWWIETKSQDFKPGGFWHFCMIAEGERHWWRVNYVAIDPLRSITTTGGPADENANPKPGIPSMGRLTEFKATPGGTLVSITIKFETEDYLQYNVQGGMMTGTAAAFNTLDELLEGSLAV